MKNIKYLLLIAVGVLASCTVDYDRVFDQSAAERMNATLKEYREVLTAVPNGWIMDYYAEEPELRTGGYVFLVSFAPNGSVTVASEMALMQVGVTTSELVTSDYQLISDQGPVLTFNTYNKLLHYFSEPKGSGDIDGFAGDYEFVMQDVSADKIVMKGKKYGNKITLRAMPEGADWQEYLADAVVMDDVNYYPIYTVNHNGAEVGIINQSSERALSFMDENNEPIELKDSRGKDVTFMNIIYTPEGFRLYEPVAEFGVIFDEFLWDSAETVYKSPDGSVVLKGSYPDDYLFFEAYPGSYAMTYRNQSDVARSRNVTIVDAPIKRNYVITNLSQYTNLTVQYNRATGKINTGCHDIGPWNGYDLQLWYWTGGSGISWNDDITIGTLSRNASNKRVITITPPVGPKGLVILAEQGGGLYNLGAENFFSNIVFTER